VCGDGQVRSRDPPRQVDSDSSGLGDRDCTVSLSSAIVLDLKLRDSELVVLRSRSHSAFEEMPEQSNRILVEWLGSHSSTQRSVDLPRAASPKA